MNDEIIITLGDRLYIGNVSEIGARISKNIDTLAYKRIILDMINVRTCDSQGIRMLLTAQREAVQLNKQLFLYRPDRILKDLLEYMKLGHIFTITDTLPEEQK
jgi:anti-anti-sigma factor